MRRNGIRPQFVFTMGLQLGPGFFASLRQQGVRLNILAAAVVVLGAVAAPALGALAGFDGAAVLGIFAGASVNIPALGAGTQALGTLPGVAYATVYALTTLLRILSAQILVIILFP